MSDTVYVCYEWEQAVGNIVGRWLVCGVVEEKEDAKLWVEPYKESDEKKRRYSEMTLNVVEAHLT